MSIHSAITQKTMGKGMSLLLDLFRFIAACVVVLGHLTTQEISRNLPNLLPAAVVAVGFFFLLSGFVIKHTVTVKHVGFRRYMIERLARILSVLIPAIALTVGLMALGSLFSGSLQSIWREQFNTLPARILASTASYTQPYGHEIALGNNGPMWSLGFEVPFYLVFGLSVFFTGAVRAALILLAIVICGPNIFLLFPIWLAGVWLYKRLVLEKPSPGFAAIAFALLPISVVGLRYFLRVWPSVLDHLQSSGTLGRLVFHIFEGRAHAFPLFYTGGIITLTLLTLGAYFEPALTPVLVKFEKPIRNLASSTFSIYLYHAPLLGFFAATSFYNKASKVQNLGLLLVTLLLCYLLSRFTEARKEIWIRMLDHIIPRHPRNNAAV